MVHDEPIGNKTQIFIIEIMEKNTQDLQFSTNPV